MTKMKVRVSNVMAKYIQKLEPEYSVSVAKVDKNTYENITGDTVYDAWSYGDSYLNTKGEEVFKVLRINYPDEYYAMPKYLTTQMMNEEYRRHKAINNGDFDTFIKELIEI